MHSVITEAQYVTNEKFNETLSMDQQPGPRPQTDYEIPYFLSQHGAFFHYCTVRMLTESSIILSSTAGPQSRDNTTQAGAKKRLYRLMTVNTEPCHSIQLWSLLYCLASLYFYKDTCADDTFMDHLSDSWDTI